MPALLIDRQPGDCGWLVGPGGLGVTVAIPVLVEVVVAVGVGDVLPAGVPLVFCATASVTVALPEKLP